MRRIETRHVPHGWDAGLFFEEITQVLLRGDLFTALGNSPAITQQEITGPALAAEDTFGATCLTPATGPAIRALAEVHPHRLGLMHGHAFTGDCTHTLRDLADSDQVNRLPSQTHIRHNRR